MSAQPLGLSWPLGLSVTFGFVIPRIWCQRIGQTRVSFDKVLCSY